MTTLIRMALLLGLTGTAMAQQTHLNIPENRRRFEGLSHIEVVLGKGNAMVAGFVTHAQVRARQNVDSVLRLFLADYARVKDTTANAAAGLHLTYWLSPTDRVIDQRTTPPPATSFRFEPGGTPALLKLQQDTLRLLWEEPGQRTAYPTFAIYLLLNSLDDLDRLLAEGGVNARLQTALEQVRNYKAHDLTNPRMAFDLIQKSQREHQFIAPGLSRSPFLSLQPNIGIGLVRNQLVPSFNLDVAYIPSRLHNVGYTVGYTSQFFFERGPTDGRFSTFRNDFLSVGFTFYHFNKDGRTSNFSRQLASFQVGIPVYRRGNYFDADAIRISSTIYNKGFLKIQPEIYMNGFFRQVFPGLRVGFGL